MNWESWPVAALAAFFTASIMGCVELLDVCLKGMFLWNFGRNKGNEVTSKAISNKVE